jgi:hypothetical protein
LTGSLFGNSSSFEVVKFPGGITIIPPQTAFLLQKPHATFNFTLNYPIYKIQDRTNELKDQRQDYFSVHTRLVVPTVLVYLRLSSLSVQAEAYLRVRYVTLTLLLATFIMPEVYRHLVILALLVYAYIYIYIYICM